MAKHEEVTESVMPALSLGLLWSRGHQALNTCVLVIMFLLRSATILWDPSDTQVASSLQVSNQIACDRVTTSRPFFLDEYLEKSLET